jgi:CheY-like chemotaxis protein
VSVTEWEYLAAREKPERAILPFVLAETGPWSTRDMDGFDPNRPGDPGSTERVPAFRDRLMREHIVSFFSDVEQLESLVGVAVAAARLTRQVAIDRIGPGNPLLGSAMIVMDLQMPGMNGADATREVLRRRPAARVIIVTGAPGSPLADQAIAAGAYACLPKTGDCGPLLAATRA